MYRLEPATDLDFLLFRQVGVLSRRQALRHMSDKAVRHRLHTGRWRLAHRAVYLTHSGPMTEEQRRWVASLAAGAGRPTYLAGISALAVLGLRGYGRRRIHVLVPAHRRDSDPPTDVTVHRTRVLPRVDRHPVASPPCTMPARSLLDAAQWAGSDDEAVTIVAAGFQQRLVGIVDVEPVLARMPRLRRRRVIVAAVADAACGAESVSEIDLARLCRRAGLPEPSRQAVRRDAMGRRRYRDAYFDEWGVHVEVDGGQHMDVRAWYADMRQHNEIIIAGERLLRFSSWMIRHRPDEVLAQIRAALITAGWRP
jgi:very-short-patch-repair endonuclease